MNSKTIKWNVKQIVVILCIGILSPFVALTQTVPQLIQGTYFGGTGFESNAHSVLQTDGSIVFLISTNSADIVTTEGAFMAVNQGGYDCWLTKLNVDGIVQWSTYVGGSYNENASGLQCDANGNIYISGTTGSQDYPTTSGSFQEDPIGSSHPFISKFDSDGQLVWSTFFDTVTSAESVRTIHLSETDQRLYFSGSGFRPGLATAGAYQDFTGNSTREILACFDLDGILIYATYMPINVGVSDVVTDANGLLFVSGTASSVIEGVNMDDAHKSVNEGYDGYIIHFDENGWPVWGTFFGGPDSDYINYLCTDFAGNLFFAGSSASDTGVATEGAYQTSVSGSQEGCLGKFSPSGELLWATYFGTSQNWEGINSLDCSSNKLYVSLNTELPAIVTLSENTYQENPGGGFNEQVIAQISEAGNFEWVSFLGGNDYEEITSMTVRTTGELCITGRTSSSNNIATANGQDATLDGYDDAFLMVFDPTVCIYGGTDPNATNYFADATCDNGTCFIATEFDLNSDGVTDILDFLLVLDQLGCIENCSGDLNADGMVTIDDLLIIIGEL